MVSKDKWIILSVVSIGISLCIPLALGGAEKFIVTPKITVGGQVDSNYFLSENNEREVFTYLIQPGIEAGYETAKSEALLDFNLNAFFYDDQDSVPADEPKASDDDYVGFNLDFKAVTEPNDRLLAGLRNLSYLSRNPGRVDALGNYTDRDKYWQNFFRPRLHYDFTSRLAVDVGYQNRLIHWLDGPKSAHASNQYPGRGPQPGRHQGTGILQVLFQKLQPMLYGKGVGPAAVGDLKLEAGPAVDGGWRQRKDRNSRLNAQSG